MAVVTKETYELDYSVVLGEEISGREIAYLFRTTLCSNWHVAVLHFCIWSGNLGRLRKRPHSGTKDHDNVRKDRSSGSLLARVALLLHSKQS